MIVYVINSPSLTTTLSGIIWYVGGSSTPSVLTIPLGSVVVTLPDEVLAKTGSFQLSSFCGFLFGNTRLVAFGSIPLPIPPMSSISLVEYSWITHLATFFIAFALTVPGVSFLILT